MIHSQYFFADRLKVNVVLLQKINHRHRPTLVENGLQNEKSRFT